MQGKRIFCFDWWEMYRKR